MQNQFVKNKFIAKIFKIAYDKLRGTIWFTRIYKGNLQKLQKWFNLRNNK